MRVFLSSTQADLKSERAVAYWALFADGHDIVRMEDYGSRDTDSWRVCVEELARCDAYVLLLGTRYGSVLTDTGLSYTHAEYERAQILGIPTLAYVKAGGPSSDVDADEVLRLEEFTEIVNDEHQVRRPYFRDVEELALAVREDVKNVKDPPSAPVFYRKVRSLADVQQYASATAERELLAEFPYQIVIADLHVFDSPKYPADVGARVRQKALQIRADLRHRGIDAKLFNEIEVHGSSMAEITQGRVAATLNADALVAIIQQRGDLPVYDDHLAAHPGLRVVCYPSRMEEPTMLKGTRLLRYTPEELASCNLVAEVHQALAQGIDEHVIDVAA